MGGSFSLNFYDLNKCKLSNLRPVFLSHHSVLEGVESNVSDATRMSST
jgi:hypothetical protein